MPNQEIKNTEPQLQDNKKPEKKPEPFNKKDFESAKQDAVNKISTQIQHPDYQGKAKEELNKSLSQYESDLSKIEEQRKTGNAQLKSNLNIEIARITGMEEFKTYNKITVNGTEFTYQPPGEMDNYPKEIAKATQTLKVLEAYKKEGVKGLTVYENGNAIMTLVIEKKDANPDGTFKQVITKRVEISGNNVTEEILDSKDEEIMNNARDFENKLKVWNVSGGPGFEYGDPPKKFPPEGFNLEEYMKDYGLSKADINMQRLLRMPTSGVRNMDIERKTRTTVVEIKDGKLITAKVIDGRMKTLSGEGQMEEKDGEGRFLRTITFQNKIINRQVRPVKVVSEYWPQQSGHPLKIKKVENYSDGTLTERTEYDKNGNMKRKESFIAKCEGAMGVDVPTGKKVPEIGEDGKLVLDDFTKEPKMVDEIRRHLEFTDESGKTIKIGHLQDFNEQRVKAGKQPWTPERYMQYLAKHLNDDAKREAFAQLMFTYREDPHDEEDYWQQAEDTLQRMENGKLVGDCEDRAIFRQRLNELQGKTSYILGMPEHATCLTLIRTADGKVREETDCTFGHKESPAFNTTKEVLDYFRKNVFSYAASGVEALRNGQNINPDGTVDALTLDSGQSRNSLNRQEVKQIRAEDLMVN